MPSVRTPCLSSEFYNYALNTKFVASVGMSRKKLNRHSKAKTIFKTNNLFKIFTELIFLRKHLDFN